MKSISDEQLKAYFLGKLAGPEAETIEIECASHAELQEQAQTVERELTDDYLRGNLSDAEIRLYETNYLITEARHKKVRIAAQLWKVAKESTPRPKHPVASPTPFWQSIFGGRGLQFAFGSLFLLLACGAVAFYLLTSKVSETDVAAVKDPVQAPKIENQPAPKPDDQAVQNPAGNESPLPESDDPRSVSTDRGVKPIVPEKDTTSPPKNPPIQTVPAPKTIATNKAALSMIVRLLPGSIRGEETEQSITIAPETKNLTLLLSPSSEPNNYKIYRAVVRTPEYNAVYTSPPLRSLSITLPAEKLENRTYIISLEGKNPQNEFESIADYTFRVRR